MKNEKPRTIGLATVISVFLFIIFGDNFLEFFIILAITYFLLQQNKKYKERLSQITDGEKIQFSYSSLLFWIKGSVQVSERQIITEIPNRIFFGLIPAGLNKDTIPIRNISNVQVSSNFKLRDILIGIFLLMTVVFIPLGLLFLDSGMQYKITFEKSGTYQYLSVPFFNRDVLYIIKEQVENRMDAYDQKSDLSLYFDKKEYQERDFSSSSLSEQLNELKELLNQGYLSEEEFDLKRKELLKL